MSIHADYVPPSLPPSKGQLFIEDNLYICPRTDTIRKLATILDEERVAHVRGTPASGKTTLAHLLESYYIKCGEPVVFLNGWHNVSKPTTHLIRECEANGYSGIDRHNLLSTNIVFIFDEAQQSYYDLDLWLGIIKTQSGAFAGPKICLFSSYGSPATGPTNYPLGSTPIHFGAEQRISITPSPFVENGVCLFYSEQEFKDVVSRACSIPTRKFALDPAACEYLYSITGGHPGATTALLKFTFSTYRSDLKNHVIECVTKDLLIQALDDESKVFQLLQNSPVQRSFPSDKKLTVEAANVLREVLQHGSIRRQLNNPGIRLCYEEGWVHSEATDLLADHIVCVLPSKLHEKFIEYHLGLRNPLPFPFKEYPSLPVFCEAVLRKFSRTGLLLSRTKRLGASAQVRPPEAQFQDEWYRAFNSLLGHGHAISSEWSQSRDGRIDFRIVGPAWGIELLRDGDRLAEHCNRFSATGAYYRWIANNWIKDWIILDCRHSRPRKYRVTGTRLWRAVFKSDYSSVYVLDNNNQVVIPEFPLMN